MRVLLAASVLFATVDAFAPSSFRRCTPSLAMSTSVESVDAVAFQSRLENQLSKMKQKDAASKSLAKEDIKVIYEDEHIIVVDKPANVLCVPGKENNPSLSEAVFQAFGNESNRADKMVVHRLGMDTSGLIAFARTDAALRQMNTLFRTRKVSRKYEALVCGTIDNEEGVINLPLMRDYEFPPFMRVSTDEHQKVLCGLTADEVGKQLLENPKESLTKYEVVGREELDGNAVTRVALTSISGRTHQLNVHCAALGHPIVGDKTYGINGEAAAKGGLEECTSASGASDDLQEQIAASASSDQMCVHAKTLSFEHPITREKLSFESASPF